MPDPCLWSGASAKLRGMGLSSPLVYLNVLWVCLVSNERPETSDLRGSAVLVSRVEDHQEVEGPRGRKGPGLSALGV